MSKPIVWKEIIISGLYDPWAIYEERGGIDGVGEV